MAAAPAADRGDHDGGPPPAEWLLPRRWHRHRRRSARSAAGHCRGDGAGGGEAPATRTGTTAATPSAAGPVVRVVTMAATSSRPAALQWSLWSTYAYLAVSDPDRLDEAGRVARNLLAEVDRTCSRFRSDSDLSRVNQRPGRWVRVRPALVDALRTALDAAEATDGLVDPCLGRTMVSLGYDTDLGTLRSVPDSVGRSPVAPRPDAWREVRVDEEAVRVPEDVALDLGAVAKAWAADVVATDVADRFGCDVVVSLGGDLRVTGPAGAAASWPVRVAEHPHDLDADPASVGSDVVVSGGLATSSTVVRRWVTSSGDRHHVVDPRTGLPADATFRTVSAVGATCVAANTATTAALVLGEDAPGWLDCHGVTARLVSSTGSVRTVGPWPL